MLRLLTLTIALALLPVACTVPPAGLSGAPPGAAEETGAGEGTLLSDEEDLPGVVGQEGALRRDAQQYAEDVGVPVEEAIQRLELQDDIGELQARLLGEENFAGLWVEHEPEFRVVVAFTEAGEETIRPYIEGQPYEEYVEVRTHRYTMEELEAAQQEASAIVEQLGGLATAVGINVQDNCVKLTIGNPVLFQEEVRAAGLELPEAVEVAAIDPENLPESNRGEVTTYTSPTGQTIYFPKQPPASFFMEALLEGTLLLDENGCLRGGAEAGEAHLVIWHHDFELRIEGDRIEVLNGEGEVVGRVGERTRMGGGEVPSLDLPGMPVEACPGPYWVVGEIDTLVEQLKPVIYYNPFWVGDELIQFLDQSPPAPEEGVLSGTLVVDEGGCLRVDGYVPIWPVGAEGIWAHKEGDTFRLIRVEDGKEVTVAAPGEEVRLVGAARELEEYINNRPGPLPCPGPYWGVAGVEPEQGS